MRFVKAIGLMVLFGILTTWVLILSRSQILSLGFSEHSAYVIPGYGFFVGLGLGLAAAVAPSVKNYFAGVALVFLAAGMAWFFAVVLEAILIAIKAPEEIVSWIAPAAFFGTILLAGILDSLVFKNTLRTLIGHRPARDHARVSNPR